MPLWRHPGAWEGPTASLSGGLPVLRAADGSPLPVAQLMRRPPELPLLLAGIGVANALHRVAAVQVGEGGTA